MFKKGRTILFSSIVIAIAFFLFPLSSYGAATTDTFTSTSGGIILSGITPDPFGFGVTLTLTGSGFGEKKGSVMFGSAKAKIIEWHDTSITCSLSKGSAGTYPVKVVIKKVGESNELDCTLSGPVINNIDPSSGDPKTYVTINGQYFGTKKPKVNFIDSNNKKKSAKVTAYSDTQLTIVIPKVTPGTYQVMVQNSAGTSGGYEFYSGTTPVDTTPPSIPINLNATATSSSQIDLSWNVSTDNVGVAGYKVYRDGTIIKSVASLSTSDTGLSASTQYCYKVSARDAANNESGQSTTACATTLSSSATITDERRNEVLDSVTNMFASLPGQVPDADNQELLQYLQSIPEIEEAGISDESSVWARFIDGRLLIVPKSEIVDDNALEHTSITQVTAMQETSTGLPETKQARLLFAHGDYYEGIIDDLAVSLYKKGYTIEPGNTTVEGLKQVWGDSVLYYRGHGGSGYIRSEISGTLYPTKVFGLWTSTEMNAANDKLYKNDLGSGRLIYMTSYFNKDKNTGNPIVATHYGITDLFVRDYMKFDKNSFVYISACNSINNDDFVNAFFKVGASVYAGWTGITDQRYANPAAQFVFDRLLGANAYKDKPENPPQRPFDYIAIKIDMAERFPRLDKSESRDCTEEGICVVQRAELIFLKNPIEAQDGGFGLLAPSISFMDVNEDSKELTINGIFGERQGKVFMKGQELSVKSGCWTSNQIKCDLPPKLAGDVQVEVDGRKSNIVPLTMWEGKLYLMTYLQGKSPGRAYIKSTADFRIRADIHAYRKKPGEHPIMRKVSFSLWDGSAPENVQDLKITYECGGNLVDDNGKTTFVLSGSGTFTVPDIPQDPILGFPKVYCVYGDIDAEVKKINFGFLWEKPCCVYTNGDGNSYPMGGSGGIFINTSTYAPTIEIILNEKFDIIANGHTSDDMDGWIMEAQWDNIPAKFPPDHDGVMTPASVEKGIER